MTDTLSARLLPLEGGVNFRDMGGYATTDGRKTRWRRLYRSGTMAWLTPDDFDHLAQHGIRTVIDFRTATEQAHEPNTWCKAAGITYWSRSHDEVFGNLHEMVDKGIASSEEAHAIMVGGFRHLPFQQGEAYAEMFRRLAAGDVPLAFNCTAGKDRTGGAAALVLSALRVQRETIVSDFNLTERALDMDKVLRLRPDNPNAERYRNLDRQKVAPLGKAHPEYIAAFLDTIDESCGGLENYLFDFGITAEDLAAVRESLLE